MAEKQSELNYRKEIVFSKWYIATKGCDRKVIPPWAIRNRTVAAYVAAGWTIDQEWGYGARMAIDGQKEIDGWVLLDSNDEAEEYIETHYFDVIDRMDKENAINT